MTQKLTDWNAMMEDEAARTILPCCGSHAWASAMAARRPFAGSEPLLQAAREIWQSLDPSDWMEAFASHPRIGDSRTVPSAAAKSQQWSAQEQRQIADGDAAAKAALADANREYERRFGRIFIVCATGKTPHEILQILRRRLQNEESGELREAADEQQQITQIRIRKWLEE